MNTQQEKIDKIIGVKADVVEALQKEFAKKNLNVDIDSQTGALTLNASVMFDYDQAELTDSGKRTLSMVLPTYCKVLLNDSYKKYLGEIIIDGYTDTDGITVITWNCHRRGLWRWLSIFWISRVIF